MPRTARERGLAAHRADLGHAHPGGDAQALAAGLHGVPRRGLHPARRRHPRPLRDRPALRGRAHLRRARERRRRIRRAPHPARGPALREGWLLELAGLLVGIAHTVPVPPAAGWTLERAMQRYCGRTDLDVMIFGDTHLRVGRVGRRRALREPRLPDAPEEPDGEARHDRLPRDRERPPAPEHLATHRARHRRLRLGALAPPDLGGLPCNNTLERAPDFVDKHTSLGPDDMRDEIRGHPKQPRTMAGPTRAVPRLPSILVRSCTPPMLDIVSLRLSYLQDQATHRAVCQDHTLALPITLSGVRRRVQRPV